MKICVDENIPYIRGRLEKVAEVVYLDQDAFTPENVKDADALLIRTRTRCDARLLAGSKVKLVATATIGMDQIDTGWCAANGITVANSPGCNAPGVAQYVWSSLLRNGFDPRRHRLGIVGCGNVGGVVADWGHKLSAEILVSDPPKQETESATGNYTQKYIPLDEILQTCDAMTLHTPLIRDGEHPTYHLFGKNEFELIRPGAILINAARGPVVDFKALSERLERKDIRAIIDTWEGEPEVDPQILGRVEIGTFHIAGYSRQGKERATRMVLEAVERCFGLEVDKSGLEGAYIPPVSISAKEIVDSYDPYVDDRTLRMFPRNFERLRHDYHYREEVPLNNS